MMKTILALLNDEKEFHIKVSYYNLNLFFFIYWGNIYIYIFYSIIQFHFISPIRNSNTNVSSQYLFFS